MTVIIVHLFNLWNRKLFINTTNNNSNITDSFRRKFEADTSAQEDMDQIRYSMLTTLI